jgi:hypothetical protein
MPARRDSSQPAPRLQSYWVAARSSFSTSRATDRPCCRKACWPLTTPRSRNSSHGPPSSSIMAGSERLASRCGRGGPCLSCRARGTSLDNAERAARLGIARTISRRRYNLARVAAELRHLLNGPRSTQRASTVGVQVRQEDGARVACDASSGLLKTAGLFRPPELDRRGVDILGGTLCAANGRGYRLT